MSQVTSFSSCLIALDVVCQVWKLCMALWGPIEDEVGGHAMTIARKEALSRWLEEAATETEIAGLEDEEEVWQNFSSFVHLFWFGREQDHNDPRGFLS